MALLLLASCSRQETVSADELRSECISAASFAAESGAFLEYVRQNRATREYAEGHLEYLAGEVNSSTKKLNAAAQEPASEQKLQECRRQLNSLADELTAVRAGIANPDALAASEEQIAKIRKALQEANSL